MFCFFFKQETAYGVRISDWSSDVCSSDLISWATVRPTRQGVDQEAGAGEASLSNEVVWRRVRDNWVGGAGQEYGALTDEEDPSSALRFWASTNELGRASCRARVCQDGEVPGVAVSLKTKIKSSIQS